MSIPTSRPGRPSITAAQINILLFLVVISLATPTQSVAQEFSVEHAVEADFNGASSVFAADVDGDGDLDVLGSNSFIVESGDYAGSIVWWENTAGDGSAWTEHTVDGSFNGAESVYAADVDGDGDVDVLGAAFGADDITWWENTAGDGSAWTEHTVDASFEGADSVYAADVDGDGDVDVLGAAYRADDITWWENTAGNGSAWTEHTVDASFDRATSVYAADVDGDGDVDVLGAAPVSDDITWWENTAGDGSAWTEHTVDASFDGATSVYAADVDGDGDVDVLGAAFNADDITWWENTAGNGSAWTEHTVDASFDYAFSVHAADVDGDGDVDVLGAAFFADDITWWENTAGDGSTWTEHTVDGSFNGAFSVYAADVDGDGDLDILGAAEQDDDITWWENSFDGRTVYFSSAQTTIDGSFDGAISVHATDMDGDGDMDVLGAAIIANDIAWWENTAGDGSAWTEHTVDASFSGATSIFVADVDGDGDEDVLGAAEFANDITWWENTAGDGSAWTEHTIDATFDGAISVHAADVDGDGDMDVLGAARHDNDITWWENTAGDGSSWTEHTVDTSFEGAQAVFGVDVDGDGDLDVLGSNRAYDSELDDFIGRITWWENTAGDGSSWTEHTVDASFAYARSVFAVDMDGDRDLDILGAAYIDDDISWWENTADDGSTWTEHTVDASFVSARFVFAADVDGDGDVDVLGASESANDITWWENTAGDGSAWTEHTVDGSFNGASSVQAADVDGDGDLDVLGAARNADDIAWWENTSVRAERSIDVSGTAGTGNDVGWRLMSLACDSQTRASLTALTITGDDEIRRFDQSAGVGNSRWLTTAESDELPRGTGFAAYLYDDDTQTVGASLAIGLTSTCSRGFSDFSVSTLDVDEEWFLAGNPFMADFDPSSLSMDGHQATVKIWNPDASSYTDVTVAADATDVISSGQGFFVQRTSVGSGSTSLTYGAAGATTGVSFIGKHESDTGFGRLQFVFTVQDDSLREIARDEGLAVLIAEDASIGWDRFESTKLRPLVPSFASVSMISAKDGAPEAVSLWSLPAGLAQEVTIPLQIDAVGVSGAGKLSLTNMDGAPADWTIRLVDASSGLDQDLRTNPDAYLPVAATSGKKGIVFEEMEVRAAHKNSGLALVITPGVATGLNELGLPEDYLLRQNYPNPFNPQTRISYALPEAAPVTLTVFDMLGRRVATLVDRTQAAGNHEVMFDASSLSSGMYIYVLDTPHKRLTQRMLLLK